MVKRVWRSLFVVPVILAFLWLPISPLLALQYSSSSYARMIFSTTPLCADAWRAWADQAHSYMVKFGYYDLEYGRVSDSDVRSQLLPTPPYWPGVKTFYIIAHGGHTSMEVDPITRAVSCNPPQDDRGEGTRIYTANFTQWMSSRLPVKVAVLINCGAMDNTGSSSINYALRKGQSSGTCAYGLRHFEDSGIPMSIEIRWENTTFLYAYEYPTRSVYTAYTFACWAWGPYNFRAYSGFVGDVSVKFWA